MTEEDKSKVDELSNTLYSRTLYKNPLDTRTPVKEVESADVIEKWQGPELDEILSRERKGIKTSPFMKKFFVFALFFFVATILVAGFVFMGGTNFISSKNVDISVLGSTSVSAGEVLELGVTISNKNNTDLELANFSIQYPTGTRDPIDSGKSLTFDRDELGVIKAGDEATRNVKFILIGSTGEVKEIKFSVEYKIKGSNATFYKDKIYEVTIGNAPISLSIESPASITSGDRFVTKVSVNLNSTDVLKNVMLRAEYPYGYSVINANPKALSEDNVWALGDLSAGSKKLIEIEGQLVGENQDERTFRFYVGVADPGSINPNFKTVIVAAQETVAIERPSIGLTATFNGENTPIYIAPAGRNISSTVRFQNNLPEKLFNPRLEVRFAGEALNKSSVVAHNNGFYNSGSNRIFWNLLNSLGSAELSPGEGGAVEFSFTSLLELSQNLGNRNIEVELILTGTSQGQSRPISISETRTVKIASQVTLSSRASHSIGPFDNSGPIPPEVGETTTYSVVLSVGNTQSTLTNSKVTARLGAGVKWVGAKTSGSDSIAYDQASNTVTWELGTLQADSGFSAPAREAAFQISLTPSASQIDTAPTLVSGISFSGLDSLTNKTVSVSNASLTTRLISDPAFIQGDDIVVKK